MLKLFTHTDLDGVGCAIIARLLYGEDIDIAYCDYNEINEAVKEYINTATNDDICFITDISISEELAKEIDNNDKIFVKLYDHHFTALGLNKYGWGTVKTQNNGGINTCGTELFFEDCIDSFPKKNLLPFISDFVAMVRDYDTWRWTTLGDIGIFSKQLNDLLYIYGREQFIVWIVEQINSKQFPDWGTTGYTLLENRKQEIIKYVDSKNKSMAKIELCGYKVGIVFADKYISELGNKLCELNNDIDFVAILDLSNNKVSYRTIRNDINLGEFAKRFGGGGHPKAAGSMIDNDSVFKFVKNLYC